MNGEQSVRTRNLGNSARSAATTVVSQPRAARRMAGRLPGSSRSRGESGSSGQFQDAADGLCASISRASRTRSPMGRAPGLPEMPEAIDGQAVKTA